MQEITSTDLENFPFIGFRKESTRNVRDRADPTSGTVTYKFFHVEPYDVPDEGIQWVEFPGLTTSSLAAIAAGRKRPALTLNYLFNEGQHWRYWLGQSANPGGSGPYTHDITLSTRAQAAALPTRTIHMQSSGLTTQQIWDLIGCQSRQIDLVWSRDKPRLMATEQFVFQRLTDQNATHDDTDGTEEAGHTADVYNTDPAPCKSGITEENVFNLGNVYHEVGETDIVSSVEAIGVQIRHTLDPFENVRTTYDNYGLTINRHPSVYFTEKTKYFIGLTVKPTDDVLAFHDYLKTHDGATYLKVKFTRTVSGVSHHYLLTFDTSHTPVLRVKGRAMLAKDSPQLWTYMFQSLVMTVESQDDNDSNYSNW